MGDVTSSWQLSAEQICDAIARRQAALEADLLLSEELGAEILAELTADGLVAG